MMNVMKVAGWDSIKSTWPSMCAEDTQIRQKRFYLRLPSKFQGKSIESLQDFRKENL